MSANLTNGGISKILSGESQTMDLKQVLQVMDIRIVQTVSNDEKERYRVMLSDGSFHLQGMLYSRRNELIKSGQLQKGSIVQLTEFVCNKISDRALIIIIDLNVILEKYDIIGHPKPFKQGFTMPMQEEGPCEIIPNENVQASIDRNIMAVAKDVSKIARMMMEKNKEDDMGACFEKLEKLGWGTGTPMYDTALLLFGESADYRKLWLHLKPVRCGNWVRNAGSQFGLLG